MIGTDCWLCRIVSLKITLCLCCRQGKDWSSLRRPISKYMLTPGVVKDYNSEFNSISRDLVSYVQRQRDGPNGDCVLQDSAASFFKLTHECKYFAYDTAHTTYILILNYDSIGLGIYIHSVQVFYIP